MPPRPFPSQLRIGTDICQVSRIAKLITKERRPDAKPGSSLNLFLKHLFTRRERDFFELRYNKGDKGYGIGHPSASVIQHLAGRWAAKEAIIKALKPRNVTFGDIEVLSKPGTRSVVAVIMDKRAPLGSADADSEDKHYRTNFAPENVYAEKAELAQEAFALWQSAEGQEVQISISHEADYATAVCLAPEMPMQGDVGGEAAARGLDATVDEEYNR
ncbi:Holo-[acyl-carrier-protein] synthase [Pseudocercospora fuligena]|uniref:Holo-[acyl-carrier-protein] synthase n=1 Tax=Pseudocercospora fuligena TaxID=685502 RepID=A0A8H6VG82_9PEZI|nr:Holo-[acyl-carrier-protein] synthase [Pseudocercospora fuligena]